MFWRWGSYSRAERGDETEAYPFSRAEVLMFKSRKQPFPNVLDQRETWGGRDKKKKIMSGNWELKTARKPKEGAWTDYGLKCVMRLTSRRGRQQHKLQYSEEKKKMTFLTWHVNHMTMSYDWHYWRNNQRCAVIILDLYLRDIRAICGHSSCFQLSVSHHGWSSLLHTAKDEGLAVFPDLILSIPQPVHQSWQNYRRKKSWVTIRVNVWRAVKGQKKLDMATGAPWI